VLSNDNIKILVADDTGAMRSIIRAVLQDMGFSKIALVENGSVGIKKAKAIKFHLIISDWDMPEMSGLEFLKEVRADETIKDTPFLMLTANTDRKKVVEAVVAHVTDYITKPILPDALKEKVAHMLKKHYPDANLH